MEKGACLGVLIIRFSGGARRPCNIPRSSAPPMFLGHAYQSSPWSACVESVLREDEDEAKAKRSVESCVLPKQRS